MQSEEFDNRIKRAAEHHHPAYDEQAWDKMEQLLDKHLPQEKDDRRRFLFFLLLFLLLGGGVWVMTAKPWVNKKIVAQAKQETPKQNMPSASTTNINSETEKITRREQEPDAVNKTDRTTAGTTTVVDALPESNNQSAANVKMFKRQPIDKIENNISVKPKGADTYFAQTIRTDKKTKKQQVKAAGNDIYNMKQTQAAATNNVQESVQASDNNVMIKATATDIVIAPKENTVKDAITDKEIPLVNDSLTINADKLTDSIVASKVEEPALEQQVAKKGKNKKTNSFFFTLSTGADISFAGANKLGTAKLLAGLGVGYTFKDKFAVRTGFYSGRKIYTASAGEYHPPAEFYVYYPYLEKVNANCKVYEIPLSLSYYFGHSSKQNWFVSTGLSSLLMKSESYDYYYKYTATGYTMHKKWSIQDQNKHFFSVLTLSGGYQRSLGKHFSILAEPYFKLPLSGVGYGKVKLNSAGILFSLGIKPFGSSRKKQR